MTEMTDEAGLIHRLWAITDEGVITRISAHLADTKLYIADGHHRYETALNYRNYLREQGGAGGYRRRLCHDDDGGNEPSRAGGVPHPSDGAGTGVLRRGGGSCRLRAVFRYSAGCGALFGG